MSTLSKQAVLKIIIALQSALLCSISTTPVCAEPRASNLPTEIWLLRAKPRICVTPVVRRICTMSTDIIWAGTVKADICLLSTQSQKSIQCWQNTQNGDILQDIASDVSITYWLSQPGRDEVLVETTIRIVTVPQRQIRRRRRHIWSLL